MTLLRGVRQTLSALFNIASTMVMPTPATTIIHVSYGQDEDGNARSLVEVMSPHGVQVHHSNMPDPIDIDPGIPVVFSHTS